MAVYARYQEYTPSGIDWLGPIPSHWSKVALHYVGRLKSGESITALQFDENGEYPVYGGNGFRGNFGRFTHEGEYVLIGRQGALCGNINIARGKFFATEHAIVVNPMWRFDTNWLGYQLITMNLNQYSVSAAQPGLSAEVIGRLKISFPPIEEQQAIARFLDFKTAQIDALIAKKKSLLDKLAEKRTALISHAVTKGLDLSVPMKSSGAEWLGDIPSHWCLKRLKFVVSVFGGGTPNTGRPEYWNGDIPWVSPKDMKSDLITETEDYLTEKGVSESATKIVPIDSVLIVVRSGILRHTIPVARNTLQVSLNQDMKALVTHESIRPGFLHWFISGLQEGLLPIWSKQGCTVESIEMDYMLNTLIPIPPIEEQDVILENIVKVTVQIDKQLDKVTNIISTLNEYRSSLITHAITGKIDVRDFVPPTTRTE